MRLWRSIKNHLVPHRGNAHRPHILRKGWLTALLGLALVSEALILGNAGFVSGPQAFLAAVVRSDVIAYTAQARTAEGGQPISENEVLNAAAQAKAEDMAAKGYFSHQGPAGEAPWTWLEHAGYDYVYAGENLAVRFDDSQAVVKAWMASPGHRQNIIKPQYTEVGVGLATGQYKGGSSTFVVQFFASPSPAYVQSRQEALPASGQVSSAAEPLGDVAGAEVSPAEQVSPAPSAPPQSVVQSASRFVADSLQDSRPAASWALGGVAAVLVVVLLLTFFVRIQVQPTDLLVPGLAVALVAIVCLSANAKFLPANSTQSASVAQLTGDITEAAATQRVQVSFPQSPDR